jgi:guanylate kinase
MNKLLLFAAPSGAGKTTIVHHLLDTFDTLAFSVSATTRPRRAHEVHGKDYYFISPEEFREKIRQDAFVEWEEVYEDLYYGTLKSEIERLWKANKSIVFDIDVEGAMNLKKQYPDESLAIFIKPPSLAILTERLRQRKTESEESLQKRLDKAVKELSYENKFDLILVNDVLIDALKQAEHIVRSFLNTP